MLVSSLDFLAMGAPEVNIYRYILIPADGRPIEYRDAHTDGPRIPKLNFFKYLMPHAGTIDYRNMPFFLTAIFLDNR